MLNLLAPLGSCLASALLMRGGVSKVQIGAAVTSAVAVLITVHSKFITQRLELGEDDAIEEHTAETTNRLTGIMFALLGAFGGTVSDFTIRSFFLCLVDRTDQCFFNPVRLHFYPLHWDSRPSTHQRELLCSHNDSCDEHRDSLGTGSAQLGIRSPTRSPPCRNRTFWLSYSKYINYVTRYE